METVNPMVGKDGFDALMDVVCPKLGYCGTIKDGRPLHVTDFIPETGPVSADQFVTWVFLGDGINYEAEPNRCERHGTEIKAAFINHMGSEVVDASQLRWPGREYNHQRDGLIVNIDGSRRLRTFSATDGVSWREEVFVAPAPEGRHSEWKDAGVQGGPFASTDLAEADAEMKLEWLRERQLFNPLDPVVYERL